ncbi:MAG: TetR family transcriptional regulator [Candidatus Obscuribacterales bacterium]|nr:TetR family transcriptional regulator [Candidatus Obscuribacterales bacterium]
MTTLKERKRLATRTAILDTAKLLFEKEGFEKTSVDEIAAAALISKFTFYNFFDSKDELLSQLHMEIFQSLMQNTAEQADTVTVTETFIEQIRRMARWSEQNKNLARMFIERSRLVFPANNDNNCLLKFSDLIRRGQATGEFRKDLKADDVTRYFFALAHGEKRNWVDSDCTYSLEENSINAAKFVLLALAP